MAPILAWMESRLLNLSKESKIAHFGVQKRKLWPQEDGKQNQDF